MKVIFLDVDGVLNRCGFSAQGLETDKCDMLEEVIRETGAEIVVSSTWRLYPNSMRRLMQMFVDRDIECVGVTPDLTSIIDHSVILASVSRHIEIREWLTQNSHVKRYAIVDDDTGANDGSGRYVRTRSHVGLTDESVTELKQILSA